jgi:hydrogenase large subunit
MKNAILGTEVAMSHLTHFYLLLGPDLINTAHRNTSVYGPLVDRLANMEGSSVMRAVKARQSLLEIMGLLAGKWPNTLAIHPSGTTSTLNLSTKTRAMGILQEFQAFLQNHFLGCSLDEWHDVVSMSRLEEWLAKPRHRDSDLGLFLALCLELGLDRIGRGPNRFLSYGGYDLPGGETWLKPGSFDGRLAELEQSRITEHIGSSFFRDALEARHPLNGVTNPIAEKKNAYSWAKAPRYNRMSAEVGPLARLFISKEPLIVDIMQEIGPSVFTRMTARLREMTLLTRQLIRWIERIDPNEPFYASSSGRYRDTGIGLIEAARGGLGHWISMSSNLIENYQIVTPSAWNMSPRDEQGGMGPVEEAVTGTTVVDPDNPVEVNLIIRSFDPCMSCTVH